MIGSIPEGALGANLHETVSGEVVEVNETITIQAQYDREYNAIGLIEHSSIANGVGSAGVMV